MESHLSKQCCQRSHDVVLHHVLTHLLTSTCTQIPVKGTHTQTHSHQSLRGDSRSEMLFVIVCVWERKAEGWGGSREIRCEQWFCFDFEETKCYLGFTERPQIRLEVNIIRRRNKCYSYDDGNRFSGCNSCDKTGRTPNRQIKSILPICKYQ